MTKVKITLSKSFIKRNVRQRAIVQSLGLRKTNSSTIKEINPQIQGMIDAVAHLVTVEKA